MNKFGGCAIWMIGQPKGSYKGVLVPFFPYMSLKGHHQSQLGWDMESDPRGCNVGF